MIHKTSVYMLMICQHKHFYMHNYRYEKEQ